MILRAADMLIMRGGRSLLVKILKGSRAKDVVERFLDKCPAHGFYKQLPAEDVLARVDWVIRRGYLAIEYDHRLPLLVFTPAGWVIETETMSDELLDGIDRQLAGGLPLDMSHLKDRDRGMIWRLLEKIEVIGDTRHIPALRPGNRLITGRFGQEFEA